MGITESLPTTFTHEKLFELTKDSRNIMNILLQYMLKEVTVRDFLALSNPNECKKYVLFMANNLYKHFYELQISPIKDKKGVIAFRSVKDLTNPPPDSEKEKQSLCLVLSYYYTRIFQIYGALALTLIDDISFMTDMGIIPVDSKKILYPPGHKAYATVRGGEQDSMIGGVDFSIWELNRSPKNNNATRKSNIQSYINSNEQKTILENFTFLTPFLIIDKKYKTKGFLSNFNGKDNNLIIYFNTTTVLSERTNLQQGIFSFAKKNATKYSYLEMSSEIIPDTKQIKIRFSSLKYYDSYTRTMKIVSPPIHIIKKIILTINDHSSIINELNQSIVDYFSTLLENLTNYISSLGSNIKTNSTRKNISTNYLDVNALYSFIFLKDYLFLTDKDNVKGYISTFKGKPDSPLIVYFNTIKPNSYDAYSTYEGIFTFKRQDTTRYTYLELYANKNKYDPSIITLTFGKLKYYDVSTENMKIIDLPTQILKYKSLTIQYKSSSKYVIKELNESVSTFFNTLFITIMNYIKFENRSDKKTDDTKHSTLSEVGTVKELRLSKIIHNLTTTKPLGHCIARALQLLKTIPLKDEPGVSYICKAKFYESGGTLHRSGLPSPGSKLDSSPGLSALALLFYDTIVIGTPKLEIGTKPGPNGVSSLQQYITFMRNMSVLFGNRDDPATSTPYSDEALKQLGIEGITNRRDKILCKDKTGDIAVPSSVTKQIYSIINELFKSQLEHAIKCGKIFALLFNIKKNTSTGQLYISLSQNIIEKGFPEIERINYIAREQLISYYTTCENKYVTGMKLVIDSTK